MKCPWWFCIYSWRGPVVGAAVCCCRWNVRESINTFLCAFPTISLSRNKLNFQVWNGGSFHSATHGSTALHLICQSRAKFHRFSNFWLNSSSASVKQNLQGHNFFAYVSFQGPLVDVWMYSVGPQILILFNLRYFCACLALSFWSDIAW